MPSADASVSASACASASASASTSACKCVQVQTGCLRAAVLWCRRVERERQATATATGLGGQKLGGGRGNKGLAWALSFFPRQFEE